jgi:hypothetical protein
MRLPTKCAGLGVVLVSSLGLALLTACTTPQKTPEAECGPTMAPTSIFPATPEPGRMEAAVPALATRQADFEAALAGPLPIVPLPQGELDEPQRLAQDLALRSDDFTKLAWSVPDHLPLRNEIIEVRPVEETDITDAASACRHATCYAVDMYNHAENMTTIAIVDLDAADVADVAYRLETQPELSPSLGDLAWRVALATPEVLAALGIASADEALSGVEKVLHGTACEQSRHLCAAPTFVVGERALWVIVDLTVGKVIGMRWSDAEDCGAPPLTEALLLGERIDTELCQKTNSLSRSGWTMDYVMTKSDGLRLTDVRFDDRPVLQSTKVVDWHVSYTREAAFGYSDAVGCPFFSSAAVVAAQPPTVEPILQGGVEQGFALVQDYVHPMWPAACMYNYRQRYEFYSDGRFRVALASNGGGCGNDGTYRPVLRIVPAGDALTFSEWDGTSWVDWDRERWQLQGEKTPFTPEGYQYRLTSSDGLAYFVEPGRGQFGDGGRGDSAFVYAVLYKPDEGDEDMTTIGPCCNTDYQQGPEKFINPTPEDIAGRSIAVWYVPQLKNDDTPGGEYCWAKALVEDGLYVTEAWPCYAGPMFVPAGG